MGNSNGNRSLIINYSLLKYFTNCKLFLFDFLYKDKKNPNFTGSS